MRTEWGGDAFWAGPLLKRAYHKVVRGRPRGEIHGRLRRAWLWPGSLIMLVSRARAAGRVLAGGANHRVADSGADLVVETPGMKRPKSRSRNHSRRSGWMADCWANPVRAMARVAVPERRMVLFSRSGAESRKVSDGEPGYSTAEGGIKSRTAARTSNASARARLASFNCGSRQSSAYRTSTA